MGNSGKPISGFSVLRPSRGFATAFKGKVGNLPYELSLALNDTEHSFTKVGAPRTNGFVDRLNRTVLNEFFREAFRKKF